MKISRLIYIAATISLMIYSVVTVNPAFGQLAAPSIGKFAQQPLVYYRVGFVSKGKRLSKNEGDGLLFSLKDEPINDKYIIRLKPNKDGTYEMEMLIRIIFFDRNEAEKAVGELKQMGQLDTSKFDIEVVQEDQP